MKIQHNRNTVTQTLLASLIVISCSANNAFASDSCNVDLEAGLTIDVNSITFFSQSTKATLYKIDKDKTLIVKGDKVDLNSKQQHLVTEYSSHIKAMVPEVRSIAIEGVDIAIEGVNLAFNELLGEGNTVGGDLTRELSTIRDELSQRFTLAHGFTLGEDGLAHNKLLGDAVEQRIEAAIEKAVMNSMGNIMLAVGKEMMASGGSSENFETRMEKFGENIEYEMDVRAEKIERNSEKLCASAIKIEQLEEQLKASIAPLAHINVISARYTKQADNN